jgi:flavin-dependent dehydrogenase
MAETLEQLRETDFLIVGGGLVGSMAAIRAKKVSKTLDVTMPVLYADKRVSCAIRYILPVF